MKRLGFARNGEDVIRLMRDAGASWVRTVPCRFRRGCVVWQVRT